MLPPLCRVCRPEGSSSCKCADGVADISLELWALEQELLFVEKVFGRKCTVVEGCAGCDASMSSVDTVLST